LSIEITSPQNGASFLERQITVSGTVSRLGASVTVNGIPATVTDHTFTVSSVPLVPGSNTITAQATHLTETNTDTIIVTSIPFGVTITSPIDGQTLDNQSITVIGTVSHPTATVTVNGVSATVNGNNFTAENVPLVTGSNTITATAAYDGSNNAEDTIYVTLLVPQSPVQYFYDDLGRLIKAQDDAGNVIEYAYDSNGNRQTKTITVP
jgi:YD repeat-containing protein